MKSVDERLYSLILSAQNGNQSFILENDRNLILSQVFTSDELLTGVIQRLFERYLLSEITTTNPAIDNWAGNFNQPKIILIGEKPAARSPFIRTYPFLSARGSSGWLTQQLILAKIPESDLLFVNAINIDDSPNDPWIVTNNKTTKIIVALGGKAFDWCKKNKIQAQKSFHPQYWKRFKSKEPYHLLELLKV